MNCPQHGPRDVVGVDLVAAHHQQGGALCHGGSLRQQTINAQQPVISAMVRLAAGAVDQLVDAPMHDEIGQRGACVQQMGCPLGYSAAVNKQVIVDVYIQRQGVSQGHIDQVDKRMAPDGNDLTMCMKVNIQR